MIPWNPQNADNEKKVINMTFPSFKELDAVGEAYAKNYIRRSYTYGSSAFDIDGFARSLGFNVIYEDFAEQDRNKNGFCADGITPLHILKNGKPVAIVFPKKTIVLERYLLRKGEEKRRRFALAHEVGHPLLDKMTGRNTKCCFHSEFDMDQTLTMDSIQRLFSMNEVCTSRLGAAILMPRFMVVELLKKHNDGKPLRCYDGNVFASEDRKKALQMADCLVVSFAAFVNRLRELNLLDYHPIEEYIAESMKQGESI